MAEAILEKAVCFSCGADVREGTQFCYNCGKPITNGLALNESDSFDTDLEKVDISELRSEKNEKDDKADKLAAAASERKRSRVGQRKPKKVVWEEPEPMSNRIFVLVCILIAVIAALIVFLMLFVR